MADLFKEKAVKRLADKIKKGDYVKVKGGHGYGNAIGRVTERRKKYGLILVIVHFNGNLRSGRQSYINRYGERVTYTSKKSGTYGFRASELKKATKPRRR